MKMKILYPLILLAIINFSGCSQSGSTPDVTPNIDYYEKITYINETGSEQDYNLILTNYSALEARVPLVTVNGRIVNPTAPRFAESRNIEDLDNKEPVKIDLEKNAINYKDNFPSSRSLTTIDYRQYTLNDTHDFWLNKDGDNETIHYRQSFILKSRSDLYYYDDIELFIWVDTRDANYPAEAITRIESSFYNIYFDMLNLFGEHWGEHTKENTISSSNRDIHILLTDIEDDKNESDNGYIAGYYYGSKDTKIEFIDQNGFNVSNQNNNVVLDSHYYFNSEEGWKSNNRVTADLISTLIHEYQHMIHYYKKDVFRETNRDRFFNEMFSMVAEDILSNKYLEYNYYNDDGEYKTSYYHPAKSRIPGFNLFWDTSSSFEWVQDRNINLKNYSMSYVMGAYFIRNYGISPFQHYLNSNATGKDGFIYSLNSIDYYRTHSIKSILQSFGTALMFSWTQHNDRHERFNKDNGEYFRVDNRYNLVPLNILHYNYRYYSNGEDQNRLYESSYIEGFNDADLRFLSLEELAKMSERLYFLEESNIYVDVGKVKSGEKIEIFLFDPNISYKFFW